jgi:hypothetical protein
LTRTYLRETTNLKTPEDDRRIKKRRLEAVCMNQEIEIKHLEISDLHVRWAPCHHGMACSQVADGGDSLQLWRVAAYIYIYIY